jgi:hypothetical protein
MAILRVPDSSIFLVDGMDVRTKRFGDFIRINAPGIKIKDYTMGGVEIESVEGSNEPTSKIYSLTYKIRSSVSCTVDVGNSRGGTYNLLPGDFLNIAVQKYRTKGPVANEVLVMARPMGTETRSYGLPRDVESWYSPYTMVTSMAGPFQMSYMPWDDEANGMMDMDTLLSRKNKEKPKKENPKETSEMIEKKLTEIGRRKITL